VSVPAIHQFLPSLAPRDAIGQHTLAVRDALRSFGIDSDIYVAEAARELRRETRSYRDWRDGTDAVMLYHAAIGCALGDWIAVRPERLVLDYHNITPPEYFEVWQPETALLLARGRSQLTRLAPRAVLGLADSAYNEHELMALGCAHTAVVPVFIEPESWGARDDAEFERLRSTKRGIDWLFVGRVAANKAQHDVIRAFALYKRVYDPAARLFIVGGVTHGEYFPMLERLTARLGLEDSVVFTGSVSQGALGAHYSNADVFVCLSDHEGFCVPVIEAMWWGVAVVAFRSSAVPETVGEAALVLDHKDPVTVAASVDRVVRDAGVRAAFIEAGRRRVDRFSPARTTESLRAAIASLDAP
jgi:glycosyltransferase involved in cell wall biosynthesis